LTTSTLSLVYFPGVTSSALLRLNRVRISGDIKLPLGHDWGLKGV